LKIAIAIIAIMVLAFAGTVSAGVVSASPSYTEVWDGRGSDSEECGLIGTSPERTEDGWIHWVFSVKGASTDARLILGGTGSGTYAPGEPLNANVWHFYTPYYLLDGLTATIELYGGSPGPGGGLVISDYCPGGYEQLEVSKTVNTSYLRTHHWDITKSVSTEREHELCGYPKIWLDGPGNEGDETATWTVSVLYNGFTDSVFTVGGTITIINTGTLPAVITSVEDMLAGTEVDVVCQEDLPYTLLPGQTLHCLYLTFVNEKVEGFNEVTVVTERDQYTADAEIVWGDPAQELYSTITIEDNCDVFGTRVLGTATEPNNVFFLRFKHFAWTDYQDACGQGFVYQNTATILETQQSASAILKVNVRCEKLSVRKTANTSYTRLHDWSIEKSVSTDNGHTLDSIPKIWLYADGRGNESATWLVDVNYQGFEDKDHNVSGRVFIKNTGQLPAVITGYEDYLGGVPIEVDFGVELPHTLPVGAILIGTYSEDGHFTGSNRVKVVTERDEYHARARIKWDDPTNEIDKQVSVIDESDLFGTVTLGTVTAPNSRQFTYTKAFTWEDYGRDKCGSYQYDNVASIVGTDKSADTSLKVNVQCMLFAGETAWAANGNVPLQLRYTSRGNWATYVKYERVEKTTTLFAGRNIPVGRVHFSAAVDGKVTITVTLTGGWEFEDVRENLKVQDYSKAPSGNPAPGRFDHKKTCNPANETCSIVVPENNFYGVHVNVGKWMPDPNFGP